QRLDHHRGRTDPSTLFGDGPGPGLYRCGDPAMARLHRKARRARRGWSRVRRGGQGACRMKSIELPPLMRDLLERRPRSIMDPWPAIERLDRELERAAILEEPILEEGRIFPLETKVSPTPTDRIAARLPDGAWAPLVVVRFPVIVEDATDWARR